MSGGLEVIDIAVLVARALEQLGVDYALGGSVATSVQGEPRSTNDIDFAVRLAAAQVQPLVAALGPDFDVDQEGLRDAILRGRSANIFHLPSMTKVALFIRGAATFDESEFARRVRVELQLGGGAVFVASAEDNLLRKLCWFKLGGEVSDRQWRDILGLLRVGGDSLDLGYARQWAVRLAVTESLERALAARDS